MTFRDALDAVLSALELDADPATVLAEHGFVDLPPEVLSSALLHFAERAPLDVADALAPIVTRVSPVPFEPDDLPPSPADSVLADGGDVFRLLREVGLVEPDLDEADPTGFDADEFGADGFDRADLDTPDAPESGPELDDPELDGPADRSDTVDSEGEATGGDSGHGGLDAAAAGDVDQDAGHTFGEGHEAGSGDPFDPGDFGHRDLDPDDAFSDGGLGSGEGDDGAPDSGAPFGEDGSERAVEGLEPLGDVDTFDDRIHDIDQLHDQHDPADLDLD